MHESPCRLGLLGVVCHEIADKDVRIDSDHAPRAPSAIARHVGQRHGWSIVFQHAEQAADRSYRQNPHFPIRDDVPNAVAGPDGQGVANGFGQGCLALGSKRRLHHGKSQ